MTPNEIVRTFRAAVQFHQNLIKTATVGAMTCGQTNATDFIICPTLCYSNDANKN